MPRPSTPLLSGGRPLRAAYLQATLVACDALCDAVDDAEVLLSRGTSLLHKVRIYVEAGGRSLRVLVRLFCSKVFVCSYIRTVGVGFSVN